MGSVTFPVTAEGRASSCAALCFFVPDSRFADRACSLLLSADVFGYCPHMTMILSGEVCGGTLLVVELYSTTSVFPPGFP